jgi:Zn-dependent protease with chaperone function
MDFFDAQARARSRSLLIVALAVAALAIIVALVYAAGFGLWHLADRDRMFSLLTSPFGKPTSGWWHPRIFFITTGFVTLVVGGGTIVRLRELRGGGNVIAHSLRARLVRYDSTDFPERQLVNIVEELSIASGVRIPEIFILEEEEGINSFCAGHTADTAVVIVTRGAADILTRDELQAILAHEFSHILNGDMRINTFLVGVLHGFLVFTIQGHTLLYLRNPLLVFTGLSFIAIGSLGRLLGSAIQAMLCRQREWLADAHAVQFTRNPGAVVSALMKIGGYPFGSLVPRPHAIESAHMFFANPLATRWFFRSHPSLVRRIRAIEPRFDGYFPHLKPAGIIPLLPGATWRETVQHRQRVIRARELTTACSLTSDATVAAAAAAAAAPKVTAAAADAAAAATNANGPDAFREAGAGELLFATALIGSIPLPLREAARDAALAPVVFFGLLLHADSPDVAAAAARQSHLPESALSPALREYLGQLHPQLAALSANAHLALADLALPALRTLAPEQATAFLRTVDALVIADFRISLHEFALRHMVRRHLLPSARPARRHLHLGSLTHAISTVLGALAHAGHPRSREDAVRAFRAGVATLPTFAREKLLFPTPEALPPAVLMEALRQLDAAIPRLKKTALAACTRTIGYDGELTSGEAGLLRIITVALDCPAPLPDAFS